MPDFLHLPALLDAPTCETMTDGLRAVHGAAAAIHGQAGGSTVRSDVRRATRLAAPPQVHGIVLRTLDAERNAIAAHFQAPLGPCEEPQFLRYEPGDFFVAHQDGNTPLLRHTESQRRRISVVLFLSEPADYDGGVLLLHEPWPDGETRVAAPATRGGLVAFRAETTHEVTPVVRGERFTVVSWYLAR